MFRRFSAFEPKKKRCPSAAGPCLSQDHVELIRLSSTKLPGNRATEATEDDHRNLVGGFNPSKVP